MKSANRVVKKILLKGGKMKEKYFIMQRVTERKPVIRTSVALNRPEDKRYHQSATQ